MLDKKGQKNKSVKKKKTIIDTLKEEILTEKKENYISTGPYILESLIDKNNKRKDYRGIPKGVSIEIYE